MKLLLQSKHSALLVWGIIVISASYALTGSLLGSLIGYIGGVIYEPAITYLVGLFESLVKPRY